MPLVDIRDVSKSFSIQTGLLRRATRQVLAVRRVSFEIEAGQTVALVGGSGSGKTTLAKILAGLYVADQGEIFWEGQPLSALSPRERARRIQMVFQDPFASLNPKLSVESQLGEVIQVRTGGRAKGADVRAEAIRLLASVQLPAEALHHYPFQFSGGQRQRIAIARALAMQPSLLIADEPLSALDVTIQAQILTLLRQLRSELGLTLLFITHDLAVVRHLADRILVMHDGKVVEAGAPDKILVTPAHSYTQALLQAVPRLPC